MATGHQITGNLPGLHVLAMVSYQRSDRKLGVQDWPGISALKQREVYLLA
jgi:hypothetical protein